jgi:hypothetical protein
VDIKPFRFVLDARDRSIVEFKLPIDPPGLALIILLWDADRDARLLNALEALRYRSPMMLPAVVAITETRGVIDFWTTSFSDADAIQRALQGAADAALLPLDRWTVNAPKIIPVKNGSLAWDALPSDDPARVAVTRHLIPNFPELRSLRDGVLIGVTK